MNLLTKKIHYAWIICIVAFFAMVINMGFTGNLYATYLPFIEAKGFTGTQGSMIITVRSISGLVCTLFMGLFYKKIGLRLGIAVTTFLGAISMLIMANAKSIGMYYLASVIGGLPFSLGATVPTSMLINNWFDEHRGVAFGITSAGSGLASFILPPVTERSIRLQGLSRTFLIISVIQFIAAVLFFLLLRSKPEDINELPYGTHRMKKQEKAQTLETTMRPNNAAMVAMVFLFFLVGGAHSAATVHLAVLGESTGYNSIIAARMLSVFGLVMAVTKLGFGEVADRIGSYRAGALSLFIYTVSIIPILFLNGTNLFLYYLASIMIGIGSGGFAMGLSMWSSDFSDRDSYSNVLKNFQIGNMSGSMALSVLPGIIADVTGSYKIAYLLLSVLFALGLALLIFSYRKKDRRNRTGILKTT